VQIGTQDKLDQLNVLRQNPHFAEFIDQCHETSNASNPARKTTLEEVLMTPLFYLAQVTERCTECSTDTGTNCSAIGCAIDSTNRHT